jgi:4-aminobutyrate aminotransferase-like enzyme
VELAQSAHPWFDWSALGMDDWANKPSTGPLLIHRLYQRGFLLQVCGHDWRCVRLEPPLTIGPNDCVEIITAIRRELDWIVNNG